MTNLDITQKTLTTSIYHSAQKVGVAADNEPTALGLVMTGVLTKDWIARECLLSPHILVLRADFVTPIICLKK